MIFLISVTCATDTEENANQVAIERLGGDEDYGFEYVLGDPVVTAAVPKLFEEYTEEELLGMTQEEFDALVGIDLDAMTRDQLRISMMRTLQQI
jgi:hypothetical protein